MKKTVLIFIITVILTSCAYKYYPVKIDANNTKISSLSEKDLKLIPVDTNIFVTNKRLNKKATKKNITPLLITVINNTDDTILFNNVKIDIFNNYTLTQIIPSKTAYQKLKQKPYTYSLYFIGSILSFTFSVQGVEFSTPVPILVSTSLAIYNIYVASHSNSKLKDDIEQKSLYNKKIPPHSKITGFIFINAKEVKNVMIRINKNEN